MLGHDMISGFVAEAAEQARAVFEELHMHPELGNMEFHTARMIENNLETEGYETERLFGTTVISMLDGGDNREDECGSSPDSKRRKLLMRADIDAIAVKEETCLAYKSRVNGVMHACGHDVHTAVLIGSAKALKMIGEYEDIGVDIIFVFQQDEEGDGKGRSVINAGIADSADAVVGFHVKPELETGKISVKRGLVYGASKMFDIRVLGKKAHGAMPHLGCDAILAASDMVLNVISEVRRSVDPCVPALVSFGRIEGGNMRNVICDKVRLSGIIRGESREICSRLAEKMEFTVNAAASAHGCTANVEFTDGYPELRNDDDLCDMLHECVSCDESEVFALTVDDFAFYTENHKSLYFFLGCGYPGRTNSPIHTGTFEADPDCIEIGIRTLVSFVLKYAEDLKGMKKDCG